MNRLLPFFLLLFFFNSFAQKELTIILKDTETDLPIEEVMVTFLSTNQGLLSNKDGLIKIELNKPSLIEFSHTSYKKRFIRSNTLKEEINIVYLESNTKILDEVILTKEEPQSILKNLIKNSLLKLTLPANLKVYTREFFKKNDAHTFYNDGLLNFQLLNHNHKAKTDILVEQNRSIGIINEFDKAILGYNLNNLMENYYSFAYLDELIDSRAHIKYNFQIKSYPQNENYYIIDVKPLVTEQGFMSEYTILYDTKKKIILEVNSVLPTERAQENKGIFNFQSRSIYHSKFKTTYRIENNDYYLANSIEEIGFVTLQKKQEVKIEVKNYLITTDFRTKVFKYNSEDIFKDKSLINKKDKILTDYWDFDSGIILTKEENEIIELLKK